MSGAQILLQYNSGQHSEGIPHSSQLGSQWDIAGQKAERTKFYWSIPDPDLPSMAKPLKFLESINTTTGSWVKRSKGHAGVNTDRNLMLR